MVWRPAHNSYYIFDNLYNLPFQNPFARRRRTLLLPQVGSERTVSDMTEAVAMVSHGITKTKYNWNSCKIVMNKYFLTADSSTSTENVILWLSNSYPMSF